MTQARAPAPGPAAASLFATGPTRPAAPRALRAAVRASVSEGLSARPLAFPAAAAASASSGALIVLILRAGAPRSPT
eukprot:CAMPEP_0170308238 /NCGR_PEP_ID=MMETSP0116_2-20130129/54553_1 /TAXON_ID=400756 /ORGANISM="Durinskia baltica, Strain CSIRO CS-38" /LENGTH=76 /DNA_ID=CAMNT_0010560409 /DNA_START=87 /DNA_END=312 /DNA_ORIENTATION=+